MTLAYELFWSFRSPYSYLVTPRLVELEAQYDVRCRVRCVYPLAVRSPEFFETRDPLWTPYLMHDIRREGAFLGLPIRWPRPDPVYRDPATGTYPKDQPYIHRLTRMGVLAAERGQGLAFLDEVSRLIWSGETDNWQEGDHLKQAAERAGLDAGDLIKTTDEAAERLHIVVEENQFDQRQAGHWGVPLMVFEGEPFFGQDRFAEFKWRLEQHGLTRRTG
jgi:2-hydroxychromene-2-carboxylate isomerase